jgi:hypothetical protein
VGGTWRGLGSFRAEMGSAEVGCGNMMSKSRSGAVDFRYIFWGR